MTPTDQSFPDDRVSPRLVIDLDAVARNYQSLAERAASAETAAVVKAQAYGLGAAQVARRLLREGCRSFFVATPEEGADLRRAFGGGEVDIWVFNGYRADTRIAWARFSIARRIWTPRGRSLPDPWRFMWTPA